MALAVNVQSIDAKGDMVVVKGKLVASGSYTTGGDTVDFTALTFDALFTGPSQVIGTSGAPVQFGVWSEGGNVTRAYSGLIGSALNNNKVKFGGSTYASELAAGAYPADVTGDTIAFEASFKKLQ